MAKLNGSIKKSAALLKKSTAGRKPTMKKTALSAPKRDTAKLDTGQKMHKRILTGSSVRSWGLPVIRIHCSNDIRAAGGYSSPEFDAIFTDVSGEFVPIGTFATWSEKTPGSGIFSSKSSSAELSLAELVLRAIASEIAFVRRNFEEVLLENYKLRDIFYNMAAKVSQQTDFISSSGLYNNFTFIEIPPVELVAIGIGSTVAQRIVRVPVGATELAIFVPLSAKGSVLKCKVSDTITGKVYFDQDVNITTDGWLPLKFVQSVCDAQNSLQLYVKTLRRNGGETETISLGFSSKFRAEMGCSVDETASDLPLAYRVTCGPPVSHASIKGRPWYVGQSAPISAVDAAKSIVVLQSRSVKKVSARAVGNCLQINLGPVDEPIMLIFRESLLRSTAMENTGRLNAVVVDASFSAEMEEVGNFQVNVLLRSSKTGRIIDEPGGVYTAQSGWRLPMLSPVISGDEFDLVLRIVPPAAVQNLIVRLFGIRGALFS